MPCNHRFIADLYPNYKLKYLFVGTFNPEWDNVNGNNANWFYGRTRNSFWNIMPQTFGYINLNNQQNRINPTPWKEYCFNNGIGITDMIETIIDANEDEHQNQILGFEDQFLEQFNQIVLTNIPKIIENNINSLCGVYLTRYCHTLNQNGIFYQRWSEIKNICDQNKIHNSCLVTPSNGYMMPRIEKIQLWQNSINICN
jgi:hypothetical protein